jgi:hypothetical protein
MGSVALLNPNTSKCGLEPYSLHLKYVIVKCSSPLQASKVRVFFFFKFHI